MPLMADALLDANVWTAPPSTLSRARSLSFGSSLGSSLSLSLSDSDDGGETPRHSVSGGIRPLVICGPSGVGKGTLIAKLLERFPDKFGFSVSHTTRGPRPGEVDGVHYFFTDADTMRAEIADGAFIEYAEVHGNIYGTSIAAVAAVQATGRICLLDIDVQGVKSVRAAGRGVIDAFYLFVAPPSMDELESRLRGRGTEVEEKVLLRLKNARAEVEFGTAPGAFDKVLVNDDLDLALKTLSDQLFNWYPGLLGIDAAMS